MPRKPDEDLFAETTMSFGEHLEELRGALFRAVVGLIVGFLIGLLLANSVVNWIQTPLVQALKEYYAAVAKERLKDQYGEELPEQIVQFIDNRHVAFEEIYVERQQLERLARNAADGAGDRPAAGQDAPAAAADTEQLPPPDLRMVKTRIWKPLAAKVTTLSAQEAFMIWLKAAFITGLIIASPYMFWQLWAFVAAGLYPHEKRYVHIYLPFSLALFWAGAAMAFFVVFRYVLRFLLSFNRAANIEAEPRISEWMSFVLMLPVGFGIAFQLPLVMLFLHRIGIFSLKAYVDKWRIAVLVIFTLSMFLTPADPVSMLMMALPLTGLYFLGIGLCKWMPRVKNPYAEGYDPR